VGIHRRRIQAVFLNENGSTVNETEVKEDVGSDWIASFWRRVGALFIDGLVLGFSGILLGTVFEQQFVQMGSWGRLFGFGIALVYFGFMNSRVFEGQTIGKTILKIRVVDGDEETIAVGRSFARYCVLGVPFFLNGARLPAELMTAPVSFLISLIVFGGGLAVIYLFVFNRESRQSLHDLASGTFVVDSHAPKQVPGAIWRPHLGVVAALALAAAVLPEIMSNRAAEEPIRGLIRAAEVLRAEPPVEHTIVSAGTVTMRTAEASRSQNYVGAQVFIGHDTVSDAVFARRLARILADNYADVAQADVVQIALVYGYDIGIASRWKTHRHSFEPPELAD
jgi:uncharacterized RDD family membrane protein YckC